MKFAFVAALLCAGSVAVLGGTPAAALSFPTKLFLSQDGLGLVKVPGHRMLTKTIQVTRTAGHAAASWTASSDQPWLSVTPSGTTGGKLKVTADVNGLAADQFYSANVTVATNGADFTDSETLHIGLWIGSTKPGLVELQQTVASVATNPVSPIAYVTDGGSSVVEYNVYSGAIVGTFKKVAPTIGDMEVSSDGATLFAADTTNYKIVALDANTGAVLGKYAIGSSLSYGQNMVYARPFGQPAIFASGGPAIAYPSGDKLVDSIPNLALAATSDGHELFGVTIGESPGTLYSYSLKLKHDALTMSANGNTIINGENCQDLAVSLDGKHVYPACGAPYEFDVYDGRTLGQVQTLPANSYPNNIEIDQNDRVIGGLNGLYDQYDVYVYSQKGRLIGTVDTTDESYYGSDSYTMKVSGDGGRLISVASSGYLMFRSLP
jgi:hypothetical protein